MVLLIAAGATISRHSAGFAHARALSAEDTSAADAPTAAALPAAGDLAPAFQSLRSSAVPPIALDPLHLPLWLQASTTLALRATPSDQGTLRGTAPAGAELKALGPVEGLSALVYYPGDTTGGSAGQGWVDLPGVSPGTPPDWILPSSDAAAVRLPSPPVRIGSDPPPSLTSLYVAVIDEASGQVLYENGAHERVPEASVTKVATTIVALEREPDIKRQITATISASAMVARDGSSTMGLEPGDTVTIETLLYGMMLPSGNDAAEQVAVTLGGTRDQYLAWMNEEVAALGLQDTHFMNPSGMDQDGHYSSAFDMAMLARYAMRNDKFRTLASTVRYAGDDYIMRNANHLLGVYPGTDGVKIGYTDNAQRTYVASVTRGGHRVYVSLMHAVDKDADARRLFDWVWRTFTWG